MQGKMQGKDLLLVLVVAGVAAAAGGVGAARLVASGTPAAETDTALLDRLDALARTLDDTNRTIGESRDEIAGLRGRLEVVEAGLHGRRSGVATASGRRRVDVTGEGAVDVLEESGPGEVRWFGSGEAKEQAEEAIRAGLQEALQGVKMQLGDGGAFRFSGAVAGEDGRLTMLGNLQKSLELRRLPEEERWQKAREEVGLTDLQVEGIQAALAERDKAIEESMVALRDENDGERRISVRRMDFGRTQEANAAYREKVDTLLNDQQKKAWHDNGYDNAFGKGAMGAATVISIGTVTQPAGDAGK